MPDETEDIVFVALVRRCVKPDRLRFLAVPGMTGVLLLKECDFPLRTKWLLQLIT